MATMVVMVLALAGCKRFGGPDGGDPVDQQQQDIEEYEDLCADLDSHRTEFLGDEADEVWAYGNHLFWLRFDAWAPTLHGWNAETDQRIDYSFSIGEGDHYNYRASLSAVATAEEAGMEIVYHVYDVNAAATEITTATLDAPGDEQRWWAYDVDGTDLYVVTTGDETSLLRARQGGALELVTTLESAGCAVAELWDFAVENGVMVFVESGRIWRLDLPSNTATWLGNELQISGDVNFGIDGVIWESYDGSSDRAYFYQYDSREVIDLNEAIAASDYQLNETFASAHRYYGGYTRLREWLIYIGSSGVFAYHLYEGDVVPLLLSPRGEVRIDYRYPRALDNGMVFVTGLTSTSGAVGADGPVYRVDASGSLR